MKTVYVLGAGFSIEAGAPAQDKIVKKIIETHQLNSSNFEANRFEKFIGFLKDVMLIPKSSYSDVPLEDIFTPLDRCLLDNVSFRELGIKDIAETRENIYYLISRMLQYTLQSDEKKDYINKFANYLVKEASVRMGNFKHKDPVSVISTNWDILLDNSIKSRIDSDFPDKAVVDYCCYVSSYDQYDNTVMPGLQMLGKGGFNVKLLKLHGSLNWLQCPRCHRIYVDFFNKIAIRHFTEPVPCRHCQNNFPGGTASHYLVSNLVMPTFLKNLSNPQYKIIWQNAGIELSEADKIIFIGYSLPQADFEMRQLLARMVKKDAVIEVVDYENSKNKQFIDQMKTRYQIFFGKREVHFHLEGASAYIGNLVN